MLLFSFPGRLDTVSPPLLRTTELISRKMQQLLFKYVNKYKPLGVTMTPEKLGWFSDGLSLSLLILSSVSLKLYPFCEDKLTGCLGLKAPMWRLGKKS